MQDEVKVSQALPPEVQLIVDEVTAKFRQELQQIMAKDEYTCLITGKAIEPWARQFLARHRHQAERETLARMEWRDIESAPKDGTPILTCRMGESVSWFNYTTVGGYAEPPEAAYWVEATECWQPFQRPHDEWRPTHWMPLPPAPEAGQ